MDLKRRAEELELIDLGPPHYTAREYQECLRQLGRIGRILGGNRSSLKAFSRLHGEVGSILDVGCGGGHFARACARLYPNARVVGCDLSAEAIAYAKDTSEGKGLTNLTFEHQTEKRLEGAPGSYDLITATLVCHHMRDDELVHFLKQALRLARVGIVLCDLHRHPLALLSFAAIAPLLFPNRLILQDGFLSIKRGFLRRDWQGYLNEAGVAPSDYEIRWHPFFRWTIVVRKR